MNEVFLIGKIIENIEFKFIINSKNISITTFKIKIETNNQKQIVKIKAYNEKADFVYRNFKENDMIFVYGEVENNCNVLVREIFFYNGKL